MVKIIAGLLLTSAAFVLWLMVMIHGWGIEPQSWWWILGGSFLVGVFSAVAQRLVK